MDDLHPNQERTQAVNCNEMLRASRFTCVATPLPLPPPSSVLQSGAADIYDMLPSMELKPLLHENVNDPNGQSPQRILPWDA